MFEKKDTPEPRDQRLEEPHPSEGVNVWALLVAGLVAILAVGYYFYTHHKRQTPPPPPPQPAAPTQTVQKAKQPQKAPRKEIVPGMPREQVIETLGRPQGVSLVGDQEFMYFKDGEVILKGGVVISANLGSNRIVGRIEAGDQRLILRGSEVREDAAPSR